MLRPIWWVREVPGNGPLMLACCLLFTGGGGEGWAAFDKTITWIPIFGPRSSRGKKQSFSPRFPKPSFCHQPRDKKTPSEKGEKLTRGVGGRGAGCDRVSIKVSLPPGFLCMRGDRTVMQSSPRWGTRRHFDMTRRND